MTSRDGRARSASRRGGERAARAPRSVRRAVAGERAARAAEEVSAQRRAVVGERAARAAEELAMSCGGQARSASAEELATRSECIALCGSLIWVQCRAPLYIIFDPGQEMGSSDLYGPPVCELGKKWAEWSQTQISALPGGRASMWGVVRCTPKSKRAWHDSS